MGGDRYAPLLPLPTVTVERRLTVEQLPAVGPERLFQPGDSDDLPFSRFDKAGRPSPSFFAASVTDIPDGSTRSLMKAPGCTGGFESCVMVGL